MTDFLEMAMADIDDVFFQEFVEQHTIDGETFDVVPYETGLKERKSHWEAGAKQNFDQGLYISQKQFFIRAADYGPAPKIGKPMEYDRISYTIKSCQNEHGLYLVTLERVRPYWQRQSMTCRCRTSVTWHVHWEICGIRPRGP